MLGQPGMVCSKVGPHSADDAIGWYSSTIVSDAKYIETASDGRSDTSRISSERNRLFPDHGVPNHGEKRRSCTVFFLEIIAGCRLYTTYAVDDS